MMTISTHSEEILLNLLNITDEKSSKRVIHISGLLDKQRKKAESVLNALLDEVAPGEGDALFCFAYGDMFIVAQALGLRAFETMKKRLEVALHIGDMGKYMELYELGYHHSLLTTMVEHRLYEKKQRLEEEKELQSQVLKERMQVRDVSILTNSYDKETIKDRRKMRKSKEVLVVEDDAFTRRLVHEILRDSCNVVEAENGSLGLQTYIQQAPNMVFLDINLPDLNGHEILKTILDIDPDAYVVMFSGCNDLDNVIQAMREGAKGFVSKPFGREKLLRYMQLCPTGS